MLKIAFSPVYKYKLHAEHRFPMLKYELLPEQLIHENIIQEEQFFAPIALNRNQLLTTHTIDYLDKLDQLNLSNKEIRNIGFPVRADLISRGKIISGGTYECAKFALIHKVSMNIAGGTHHSFSNRGEGFCIYNDIALATNILLKENLTRQVLIIDLDVHQGNGTAKIFENETKVFTFCMHGEKNYPIRKENSDLDIGLPDGCDDKTYLKSLKTTLPLLIEKVKPDIIFYLCGVDVMEQDKLGRLALTIEGARQRDRFVLEQAKMNSIPIVCSMGGGYAPLIKDIVNAHVNTFREAMDLYY
jgi:acetoin utilization deacetylase AcuC-like enzyme